MILLDDEGLEPRAGEASRSEAKATARVGAEGAIRRIARVAESLTQRLCFLRTCLPAGGLVAESPLVNPPNIFINIYKYHAYR